MPSSYRAVFAGVLLTSAVALAAPPAGPPIRVPEGPRVPDVMPQPPGPLKLTGDALYVVDGDQPYLLFASPKSLVKVTRETGPLRFRARFADGNGSVETRTYSGKYLAVIEAAGKGSVELLVVPQGAKTEADAIVRTIEVDSGAGPQPPPKPPEPGPKPEPKPPEPVTSFQVLLVYESGDTLTAAQNSVLYGRAVEEYLTARCTGGKAGWGRRDKDADPAADTTGLRDLWAAVKPRVTSTPLVAVAVNNAVTLEPLPATPEAMVALLKKYAGDK